jgi:hypothetical protein
MMTLSRRSLRPLAESAVAVTAAPAVALAADALIEKMLTPFTERALARA